MALVLVKLGRPEEASAQADSVLALCGRDHDLRRRARILQERISVMARRKGIAP